LALSAYKYIEISSSNVQIENIINTGQARRQPQRGRGNILAESP